MNSGMNAAQDWLRLCSERVQLALASTLESADTRPQRLHAAMRYAALNGGKRFRAGLIYAVGEALGINDTRLDPLAVAVELIHAYSLVHDDLPAMDDDDLRRGQPTLHVAWDEATAILAGDALQALAFEVLAQAIPGVSPSAQLLALGEIARAIGSVGMAGGQALDLEAEGQALTTTDLEVVHRAKTGQLIEACIVAPARLCESTDEECAALRRYARGLGLAYQVHDDILDETVDTQTLGKNAGADLARNKSTYPAQLGIDGSRELAESLAQDAISALQHVAGRTQVLEELALWAVRRGH